MLAGTTSALQGDLEQELGLLVDATVGAEDGRLESLLSARYGFLNESLAKLYGVEGVTGSSFQRVSFDGLPRRGVLTGGLTFVGQAKESGDSIVQLGRFIRESLLCQTIPPPPEGVETKVPTTFPLDWTYRQKFEATTTSKPLCAGCHRLLNGPGFAFLHFDNIGRYRTADSKGTPIDSHGELTQLDGETVAFTDAPEMIERIARSQSAEACFTRQWLTFAMGRTLASTDAPLDGALRGIFAGSKGSLRQLVVAFVRSESFVQRGPEL